MAGFGSSIKLNGENEYQRALKQINQSLREVGSEMKVVSSAYDKNDKSTQAIAQRSDVLNKTLEQQQAKLDVLKNKYNEMNDTYGKSSQAQKELTDELTKEKAKLDEIGNTLGKTSKEYQDQQKVVDQLEDKQVQYNNAVSKAKTEMNQAQAEVNKTTKELNQLGKEEDDVTKKTKIAGDGFTVFKGILANLGTQAINSAISGIKSMSSALVNVGKQAIESYADYEQLVGGVDTLFKDSSQKVQEYASNSYKTAGISANQYMEQVTSFSASLIQSLGGDTEKAAEYGNRAIIDMSDNANKMGTDMSMIQSAYQGFAKQNYTMLDNLKLGYGGTKTEMQRLIADASKMTDVQKELGITVDGSSMSFDNIVNAISVMQSKMGIAGTTSKEASETISGSVNSMKSAWQNLLTGMADDNANFEKLVGNFVDSLITSLYNLLPRIHNVIEGFGSMATTLLKEIIPKLLPIIVDSIYEMIPTLVDSVKIVIQSILNVLPTVVDAVSELIPEIIGTLLEMMPQLIDVGIKGILSLIQGITKALPKLIAMLPKIIKEIVDTLLNNLPMIIETGVQVLVALINGLAEAIPQLIDYIPQIIETIVTVLIENLPLIIDASIQIMVALINGLIQSLPKLIAFIPKIIISISKGLIEGLPKFIENGGQVITSLIQGITSMFGNLANTSYKIVTTIIDKIKNLPRDMVNWGKDMIQGLINGIKAMIGKVGDAVKGVANKIKSFLHFSRPDEGPLREYETWMPDFIQGLSNSLDKASPKLINQVKSLSGDMEQAMQPNMALNGLNINGTSPSSINNLINYKSLVEAFEEALEGMKIELDDEEVGSFVKRTVENAIYT
jgi:phage-related protein